MTQHKSVDTSTLDGLRQAERLKSEGWQIVRTGLFMIHFQRDHPIPSRRRTKRG